MNVLPFLVECRLHYRRLSYLFQQDKRNTGNNRLGHKSRFLQQSSSSRYGKQHFNLFCCFFHPSAFCRVLLELKTQMPMLVILATKIHYPNIHCLQQTSCVTLIGHLNNAYISWKTNPEWLHTKNNNWQQLTL